MLRISLAPAAALCLFAMAECVAQELPPMFVGEAPAAPPARHAPDGRVLRERAMTLAPAWRSGLPGPGETRLALFPDCVVTGEIVAVEELGPGRTVARGRLARSPLSSLVLARAGDALHVVVTDPSRGLFELTSADGATVSVREIDPTTIPPCGGTLTAPKLSRADARASSLPVAPPPTIASTTVDVAVVYTAAAAAGAGGSNAMHAAIDAAITQANLALTNSFVPLKLRVVYRGLIPYDESGDMNLDLNRLTFEDGYLDEAFCLRDRYGADQVALITETGQYGGLAWIMCTVGDVDPFSVSLRDSISFYVLAHELGHNFGCDHDRNNASSCRAYSYSWGHRFDASGNTFKDIMAYPPGDTIPYYSTPLATYLGQPVGVAPGATNAADNARTISNNFPYIAAYRTSTNLSLLPPLVPVGVTATPIQTNVIRVTWNATCEVTGYRVLRDGVQVGITTSNQFTDAGLAVTNTYCYRIVATNSAGSSPTSAIACATTPTIPPFVLDGVEDQAGYLLSNPGMQIYAAVRSQELYVATWSPGNYPGDNTKSDHFIFIATQVLPSASLVAPWAKSGMVSAVSGSPFVAGESQNDYVGWDGAVGSVYKTPLNSGKMEGVLNLVTEFGQMPTSVYVAATAYGTLDGGGLAAQAPAGSGPNLDPNEYLALAIPALKDINGDGTYDRADPRYEFVQSDVRQGASGGVVITWAAVPGRVYAVSASPTPNGSWSPLATVTAQTLQTVLSYTNAIPTFTSAVYRVQLLP